MDYFEHQPPIEFHEIPNVLAKADMLLLTTQSDRKDIIPQKFWDYLPALAPILCINDSPELHDLIKETKRGRAFEISQIRQASDWVKSIIVSKEENKFAAEPKVLEKFNAEAGAKKLLESFQNLTSKN
jgi:hypothetical protein